MSIAKVKEYLRDYGRDCDVQEFPVSSATVELAAKALSVEPARIAKTLSFHGDETNGCILIVTAGDMKIDNARFKKQFGFKARMLGAEEVAMLTGHEVGGVYLDVSMQRFPSVFPAAGSASSAIELTCEELFKYSQAREWIDVCKAKDVQAI
mgnify:CR=1 FL=1